MIVAQRKSRAGSWATFVRRYRPLPINARGDAFSRLYDDPLVLGAKPDTVWTIVDGDNGELYVVPGFAVVNYVGRIVCEVPYPPSELGNTGYVY